MPDGAGVKEDAGTGTMPPSVFSTFDAGPSEASLGAAGRFPSMALLVRRCGLAFWQGCSCFMVFCQKVTDTSTTTIPAGERGGPNTLSRSASLTRVNIQSYGKNRKLPPLPRSPPLTRGRPTSGHPTSRRDALAGPARSLLAGLPPRAGRLPAGLGRSPAGERAPSRPAAGRLGQCR